MNLTDIKNKLEFHRITDKLHFYSSSDLNFDKINQLEFFTDINLILIELEKTNEVINFTKSEGLFELSKLKDIYRDLDLIKIEGNYLEPLKYISILNLLVTSREVKTVIKSSIEKSDEFKYLINLSKLLFSDKIIEHNIDSTIDSDGNVKDSASNTLRKIRKDILATEERIRKTLSKILKDFSEKDLSRDDIITQRDGRLVIPVKVENKRKVQGIIHNSSTSGATVFIEPNESIELNNEITDLKMQERREIQRILIELSKQIASISNDLKNNLINLAELDFIQAKARYAMDINAVIPVFSDNIRLKDAYHPILIQTHKKSEVVPLNLNITSENNTLIITGPNAGGKTVTLKTLGLLSLMTQCGLLIPVHPETEIKIFHKIFVNIGDEQSLENDLSTFSSHLISLKQIIDNSNENSLILIDEICSGTDPNLGSALSSALILKFTEQKSFSIVTTHIGELKKLALNYKGILNGSLEFDMENLSPTFRFVEGVPGQSFTFEIARKFNYPSSILNKAREFVDTEDNNLEDLIKDLMSDKQKYEKQKNEYDRENIRLKGLVNIYDSKIKELEKQKKEILKNAKEEAKLIVSKANSLIEKTVKDLKENKNSDIKEIRKDFKTQVQDLIKNDSQFETEEDEYEEIIELNPGEIVKIKNTETTGEVIEVKDETVILNVNGITIKSKKSDLEKAVKIKSRKEYTGSSVEIKTESFSNRLDLRGKYSEEINDILEEYIRDAKLNKLKEVTIVHGKGTGKLRDEVKKIVSKNKDVLSFRLGNWNEGDMGVTVLEL
ncbi:MAG TPA: endonuclease MutS2 [Ignavibacteria bacterium]|nr:endonuclease MutS2 [Ignavibacteria bacterium]